MAASDELTVEELSSRTGISVRNLRFYTTKGLVPPPAKRGRTAVYNGEHVARFELLQELQGHGLSLSAIERFFESIPADATPEQIALHRVTLRPLGPAKSAERARRQVKDGALAAKVAAACEDIYRRHSRAMADELEELFRESLWPAYKSGELGAEQLVTLLDNWEQDGAMSLIEAFSEAVTESRRAIVARRAGANAAEAG